MYAPTCCCSDPDCRLHGCKAMRQNYTMPSLWSIPHAPVGCVCPPTSEQTCQRPNCPRRDPFDPVTTEVNTPDREPNHD